MSATRKRYATCTVCKTRLLDNGACMYGCRPEAKPSYLRSLDRRVAERQRRADRGDIGGYLTPGEVSAGVARAAESWKKRR